MANRLYNKQVSPKGYKAGGRAGKMGGGMMMKRPMMKEGGKLKMVMKGGKKFRSLLLMVRVQKILEKLL